MRKSWEVRSESPSDMSASNSCSTVKVARPEWML